MESGDEDNGIKNNRETRNETLLGRLKVPKFLESKVAVER